MNIFYLLLSITIYSLIIYTCVLKSLKYLKEEHLVKQKLKKIKKNNKIIMLSLKTILLICFMIELFIFWSASQKVVTLEENGFLYLTIVFIVMSFYTFFISFIGTHLLELNLDEIKRNATFLDRPSPSERHFF